MRSSCTTKKGLWSPDEDQRLTDYVINHGHASWASVPIRAGLQRNGKSCRLRWINYLRPGLKRGPFSIAEEETILNLHRILGNKWSQIAHHLPGRTDNDIKNYWHSCLKKTAAKMAEAEVEDGPELSTSRNSSFESFQLLERSQTDTDQSRGAQMLSLPKVLFAEWLSFDQYNDYDLGSYSGTKNNAADHSSDLEGTSGVETNMKPDEVYVDDILQSPFRLEYQISESGLLDCFTGEFCANT